MALIIADRVKESTITTGTGRISLSGATFGGFQTFAEAIGDGNITYYCIQSFDQFEIGIGEYRASDNSISRDTIFQSSNNDNLVDITGVSIVFSVVPADRLVYKDADDAVVFPTPFAFKRSDDGDYWQAYSTDHTNRVSSFFLEEGTDPTWKIGLKTSASQIVSPYYAYVSAKDGFVELKGNAYSILSIGDQTDEGLKVDHRYQRILDLTKDSGSIYVGTLDIDVTQTTTLKNTTISSNVLDVEASVGHAADLQTWSVSTDELASINSDGDFETIGDIIAPSGRFTAIRYSDGSIQTSAGLAIGSGVLIDQNAADIVTQSGYFQDYIDGLDHSATAVSGWARSYIDQTSGNLQDAIDQNISDIAVVSGLIGDADFLPGGSGSLIDQNTADIIIASGALRDSINELDSDLTAASGALRDDINQNTTDITTASGALRDSINELDSDLTTASGALRDSINQTNADLATASGALRDSINQNTADIATASGALRDSINQNTADIATASGALRDSINQNTSDIGTVSGLLTPSGESFDFTSNILTYNNSYGGSFTADLSSLSTFDTSGVSLAYSAGTLTYTNNAGGSFDVDLSSISGDVYAMIVDGAPTTLDTLNEIAAALNDDANVANTLTTLIGTTSGNLQSQITDNDNDISQLNIDVDTVSGLLYGHWTVSDGVNSENIYAGETVSFSGIGGTFVSYDSSSNIVSISGASDPTGVVSGIAFFGDDGVLTGNGTLTYDGQNIEVDGYINASGERVITSSDIHHIVQLTQAEYDAITPDSATFYIITDAPSISGYFESRVDQADADILTVSGLLGSAGGSSTGVPSGIGFFDDSGSLSGNNTFIYDGSDVRVSGRIFASGEQVITSDEIFHIKQLTQAEYDLITPDSATFYIITDAGSSSVIQSYREVSSDTTILSTDYTINATASLVLTLPTAIGNEGLMYNIKNTGTGNVIVSGVSSQTIDNQPSFEISTQYQSIKIQSTNSNWIIL